MQPFRGRYFYEWLCLVSLSGGQFAFEQRQVFRVRQFAVPFFAFHPYNGDFRQIVDDYATIISGLEMRVGQGPAISGAQGFDMKALGGLHTAKDGTVGR